MARMSQEKMENTIYTTQPETIGIPQRFYTNTLAIAFMINWCFTNENAVESVQTTSGQKPRHCGKLTEKPLMLLTHIKTVRLTPVYCEYMLAITYKHLFSLTPPVCCTALKRWCLWEQAPSFEGQKRRIRDTSIHHPFDPLWENLNSLGQGLNNNKKSSKTELIFLFVLHRMAYSFFSLAGTNWATVDLFSSEGDVGCGKAGISIGRWCEQS